MTITTMTYARCAGRASAITATGKGKAMPELIPVEPLSAAWHIERSMGVTATDIVTILGLSSWDSAYSLYWRKLGQVPEVPDSDRFRLGRSLEHYAVHRWHEANPGRVDAPSSLLRHSGRSWQMATVDRLVRARNSNDDEVPLEAKSWADADRHAWSDGPPPKVRAQVLWQMDVMDVPVGHVGVVFLPSGEFRSYVIGHNTSCVPGVRQGCTNCEDQALMRERGAEFYARLQGELPPPDIDASAASLAAVKARFGDARKEKTVSVDGSLYAAYSDAKDVEAHWHTQARGYENQLREQIGEAGAIEVDGHLVAHRLVYDANVKAHTRHVDSIRRVKQQGDDNG